MAKTAHFEIRKFEFRTKMAPRQDGDESMNPALRLLIQSFSVLIVTRETVC